MKPLLQIALDHTDLISALETVHRIKDYVDVVECGTILCLSEGIKTVNIIKTICPEKIIVCDLKCCDAGEILAKQAFGAGANWMTVVCAAPLATMITTKKIADSYNGEIQIELFGNWTFDDAKAWVKNGITQAIYHRGRDAQAAGQGWSQEDLDKMKRLSDLGIGLSITGGITPESISTFKDINAKVFIAGRALSAAADPQKAATEFREEINKYWH